MKTKRKLTKQEAAAVRSLIEDSGYSPADARKIVLAGGIE